MCLALCGSVQAQEVETRDLSIRKLPELPAGATHGYREYRFEISNASPDRTHEVRIEMPATDGTFGGAHVLRSLSNTAVVAPSSTVRLDLYQPPLPAYGNAARLIVDARTLREGIEVRFDHPTDPTFVSRPGATVSTAIVRILTSQRLAAFPLHPDPQRYVRATTPVEAWSESWLAYSGYDGIALRLDELRAAPSTVLSALLRYVEAGGSLYVVGPPERLDDLLARDGHAQRPERLTEGGMSVRYVGLGAVLANGSGPDTLSADGLARLDDAWQASRDPWGILRDPAAAHRLFAVMADVRVPVRGIFLVVVAFTILVGPVNLIWLTRRRRRIRMLWTVPAISIGTCLIVFVYAMASEGLLSLERHASLTVLDEGSHRAVTFAWTGFYSTLTPSGGLVFDRRSEVSPILGWSYSPAGGGGRRVDWQTGQNLTGGWIQARLPAYFVVRKNDLRRERLTVRRDAAGPRTVTNGLGADATALFVADFDGRVYATTGLLPAGASGDLAVRPSTAAGGPSALRRLYRADFPSQLDKLSTSPALFLRPGTYVALLAQNPFLESGIPEVREIESTALVYGFLKQSTRPPAGDGA